MTEPSTYQKPGFDNAKLAAPIVMVVACAWMIRVEFTVGTLQSTMVCAVLPSAGEALMMSAMVRSVRIAVHLAVLRMITIMLGVVVPFVSRSWRGSYRQRERCGRQKCVGEGHLWSPRGTGHAVHPTPETMMFRMNKCGRPRSFDV